MGQPVVVRTIVLGDVAVLDTDRNLSGQGGAAYASAGEAAGDAGPTGRLAARLFGAIEGLERVFVASNQVVLRRRGGWDEAAVQAAAAATAGLFVHYDESA